MFLNIEKYHYRPRKKKKKRWKILAAVILLSVLIAAGWIYRVDRRLRSVMQPESQENGLPELWNNRMYDEIIYRSGELLAKAPLDYRALTFKGFSSFYKAVSKISFEEKILYLDEAVSSLRLARLSGNSNWSAETAYVLGKAYYHKGKYYFDLAIRYLEEALRQGYSGEDIYDYLGLSYTQLDDRKRGLEYFVLAYKKNPTDLLMLTMAQNYFQLKMTEEAEEYLIRAINRTDDKAIEEKSRFLLGRLYFERGAYFKSENEYQEILELNSRSADAHYYLGEIYLKLNDLVKARSEWRKALIIDPSHYGAKLRYYK